MVVAAICAVYVVLGTAMEELSMILLTSPCVPGDRAPGFDPIWFASYVCRGRDRSHQPSCA